MKHIQLRTIKSLLLAIVCCVASGTLAQSPFPFRSMHLDVSRHFFPVEIVKQYIDSLSKYNFNHFHWHLTDDQGWRIEIKGYPLLTEIGGWRISENGERYGGYYTQEQIKGIVTYASQRGIEIIPEIDLPGHMSAAIAAYPWLSCDQTEIEVPTKWGIHKTILCRTDTVSTFVKNVLNEVCELFPGKYVHIGGDEVPKKIWRKNDDVKQLKKDQDLRTLQEVQNYFMNDIAKYLRSKGKTVIVWGEVTRSEFSKDWVVMSWRGKIAGIRAAKNGNQVVMAPRFFCYFDYPQSRKEKKTAWYQTYTTNEKVARFSPLVKRLSEEENKLIIGGAGMLWTEHVPNSSRLWHQLSPRAAVLGKVLMQGPKAEH